MIELYLFLIIIFLLGYLIYLQRQHEQERIKLIDRIMAKSLDEVQKVEYSPNRNEPQKETEYVELNSLSDEEFNKFIERDTKQRQKQPTKTLMAQFREKVTKRKK